MKAPEVSIIIPAYNEEELIESTLAKVFGELKKLKVSHEVVVVSDGSRDKTAKIVKSIKNKNLKFFELSENQGKGAALREGILKAKGKKIIFMDADLSVPLKFLKPMLERLEKSDIVIGTRRVESSKIVVHQPVIRETLGRGFTKLTQIMTSTNLSDYTCGFKGFKKNAAKKIFQNSTIDRWAYDSEILFLAGKYDYKINELAVEWYNRAESKVKLGSAIFTSLMDLFQIRISDFQGKYEK